MKQSGVHSRVLATRLAGVVVTVVLLCLGGFQPAHAVNDYPYSTTNQVDRWGFYTRNCTSYVAWRMERNGVAFSNNMRGPNGVQGHWGNAYEWDNNATRIGYAVDGRPALGAVAQWNEWEGGAGGFGHVAYVERINTDGSVLISEYNWSVSYGYTERTVRAPRYIHIKDLAGSDTTAPSVSWRSPVGNGGRHDVSSGTIGLEASASDNVGVSRVKFTRWDHVGQRWVDIASVSASPWRIGIDVASLNREWNQINVQAWDAAGNASTSPYIWLYRTTADTTAPSVSWRSPVGNGGRHDVSSGTIGLEASASDNVGVSRVKFTRWDHVGQRWVDIASVSASPWRTGIDVASLNREWNQINVQAWDAAGNASTSPYIWLYRIG